MARWTSSLWDAADRFSSNLNQSRRMMGKMADRLTGRRSWFSRYGRGLATGIGAAAVLAGAAILVNQQRQSKKGFVRKVMRKVA